MALNRSLRDPADTVKDRKNGRNGTDSEDREDSEGPRGPRGRAALALGVALLLIALVGPSRLHADTPAGLVEAIAAELEALHSALRSGRREAAEQRRRRQALADQVARLEAELREAESARAAAAEARDDARARREALDARGRAARTTLTAVRARAARAAAELTALVKAGLPVDREARGARLEALGEALEGPLPKPPAAPRPAREDAPAPGDSVMDFLAVAEADMAAARRIELWNGAVVIEGGERRVESFQARVGHLMQVFQAERGPLVGVSCGSRAGDAKSEPWRIAPEPALNDAAASLIEQLRGRRKPGLLTLPLPAADAKEGS